MINPRISISLILTLSIFSCTHNNNSQGLDKVKDLYYQGLYDRARITLDSIMEEDDEISDLKVWLLSADIDIKLGQYANAANALDTVVLLDHSYLDTVLLKYQQIIDKLSEEGRYTEEIYYSQKIFLLDRTAVKPNLILEVSQKFLLEGDTSTAIEGLLFAHTNNISSLQVCFILARIYQQMGTKQIAVDWIDSALVIPGVNRMEVNQEKAKLLVEIAQDYLNQGKTHEAMTYLTESAYLTNGSVSAEASWLAGSLLVVWGKNYEASIYLERVLELERSSVLRDKALRLLNGM
ncbi:MAG: hypothetical protein APR63_08210 [Desulfuromonas sp. SDB]|nr:MAG: hypothetical protein APR63_08210 [Desulfuromonas sp. SDB]